MTAGSLPDPRTLFDVSGRVAIITGATGAFGALAAEVLAMAGARLVLAAGRQSELGEVAARCQAHDAQTETVAARPATEAD
jgi:NADP-dependent 3-hydroxy acid dehydrogenase YdfG